MKKTYTHPIVGDVLIVKGLSLRTLRLSVNHSRGVRLSIPWHVTYSTALKFLESKIEWVAEDTDGNMASPEDTNRVAWYMDGFLPGEKGNMVIAGHRDSKSGPAVFYELEKLDTGDTVKLKDIKGTVYVYRVTDEKVYSDENFPVKEIFGRSDRKKLNLITCKGSFDKSLQQYSHRVVVEAELSYSYWSGFL